MFAILYHMPVGVVGCAVPVSFTTYRGDAVEVVERLTTFDPEWHQADWVAPIITIEEVEYPPQEDGNEEWEALKGL